MTIYDSLKFIRKHNSHYEKADIERANENYELLCEILSKNGLTIAKKAEESSVSAKISEDYHDLNLWFQSTVMPCEVVTLSIIAMKISPENFDNARIICSYFNRAVPHGAFYFEDTLECITFRDSLMSDSKNIGKEDFEYFLNNTVYSVNLCYNSVHLLSRGQVTMEEILADFLADEE
ncbi:MAG: hypothetical protein WCR67_03300 [Bacilli bacterium]